ncbi:hypothetical protein Goklo_029053, partial [Gossypium klotzschianum]|nr:hypothetical protein [Gossypium klotzschianum]
MNFGESKRSGNGNLVIGNSPFFVENKKRSLNSRGSNEEAMLSFTSSVILPSPGVVKSSGKCRKKVAESFRFCFVDFLFVSHFPTNETKVYEKLLKDHIGKYATGDEVSMVSFILSCLYMPLNEC